MVEIHSHAPQQKSGLTKHAASMTPEGNWASTHQRFNFKTICDVTICSCIYVDSISMCNYYRVSSSSSCIFFIRSRVSCGNTPMIFLFQSGVQVVVCYIYSHFLLLFDTDLDLSEFYVQTDSVMMFLFSRTSIMAITVQCISIILLLILPSSKFDQISISIFVSFVFSRTQTHSWTSTILYDL